MKCDNCLHFGVCVYARLLSAELLNDVFKDSPCPDFADTSHSVKEFAKFIIDKARDEEIHVMDIPDYVAEFTRAEKEGTQCRNSES